LPLASLSGASKFCFVCKSQTPSTLYFRRSCLNQNPKLQISIAYLAVRIGKMATLKWFRLTAMTLRGERQRCHPTRISKSIRHRRCCTSQRRCINDYQSYAHLISAGLCRAPARAILLQYIHVRAVDVMNESSVAICTVRSDVHITRLRRGYRVPAVVVNIKFPLTLWLRGQVWAGTAAASRGRACG
jgi:hypothetical protein